MEREDRFFVRAGLYAETAVVQAHDLARQAQADARAFLFRREEGDEDTVLDFLQDSRAVVADLDSCVSSAIQLADQSHFPAFPPIERLDRVEEQVDQDLFDEFGVCRAEAASMNVIAYAMTLMEKHKTDPKKNIIGALLEGNGTDKGLTEDEFVWFFLMLISAGNESTRTVTSHGMRMLMENPDQLQYLVDHPDKIPNACEEMLRYNTAFIMMRRTAMEDIDLAGMPIKKGDKIILHYHTVNHDEGVFGDDAMKFDVTRGERMPDLHNQHRAFGVGQHFCLGTHLARLEMQVMFEEIIPRLRNPKLVGDVAYDGARNQRRFESHGFRHGL